MRPFSVGTKIKGIETIGLEKWTGPGIKSRVVFAVFSSKINSSFFKPSSPAKKIQLL